MNALTRKRRSIAAAAASPHHLASLEGAGLTSGRRAGFGISRIGLPMLGGEAGR